LRILPFKQLTIMRKEFALFAIGLFFSFNVSALNRFVEKSFFSQALNKDKTYFVSCPDGYNTSDTTKKYPVIIFLHGASVNAQDIVEQFDSIVSLPFAKILFPNFFKVIFCIADGSAPPYLGSFYSNSELYGNFETYIATDFYNEIHQKYNTYNHREKWSLLGHSMGGYGSMKIALKYPNQFIGIASLSGPLHTTYYNDILPLLLKEHGNTPPYVFPYQGDVTKLIYSMAGAFSPDTTKNPPIDFPILSDGTVDQEVITRWEVENPINFIRKWNGNPPMAIFTYCGELDEYKLLSQNQIFADSLTAHNIQHTFKNDPNGDHVNSLLTSFPLGLNFLFGVMDTAQIRSTPNSVTTILKQKFYIYPNPAKDRLNFSISETNGIEKVTIISIMGSSMKTYSSQNLKNGLDISALKPGYYLLSVTFFNGRKENFNFIKTD
jgi:pimeloyl-ACP methyl ester carboxylesterase